MIRIQGTGRAAALLLSFAMTVTACGQQESPTAGTDASPSQSPDDISITDVRAAFASIQYDYSPIEPDELMRLSEIVVAGEVTAVHEGRLEDTGDQFSVRNSVVQIEIKGSAKGHLGPGDSALIELPVPASEIEDVVISGVAVVAHLDPAPRRSRDFQYRFDGAEIKAMDVLWVPAHPQGFQMQVAGTSRRARTSYMEPLTGAIVESPTKFE